MAGRLRFERRLEADPRRSAIARIAGAVGGLLVAACLLWLTGRNPGSILADSFEAVFGSQRGLEAVAIQSIPILMCAIAVALSMRMRVWNIGSDGQFLMGAFAALGVGIHLDAPGWLLLPLMAVAGMIGGALWILIPAVARARLGVNEIITTLLLNFVALQLVLWASLGFWRNKASQVTQSTVPVTTTLPKLPGLDAVTVAVLVPLVLTGVLWLVFRSSRVGFEIDLIGGNPKAAGFAGVPVSRRIILVMLVTGAIAGLGGMLQLTGAPGSQALSGGFSARYGLSGFIVAALAGSSFVAVLVAGLVVSAMFYAGVALQTKGLSVYIIFAVYGAILLGLALGEAAARFRVRRVSPLRQEQESPAIPEVQEVPA